MSLLLLFHPRVLTNAPCAFSSTGTSTFSVEGASLNPADVSIAGVGDMQAQGGALALADAFSAGLSDLLTEGAGGAVIQPEVVVRFPDGDGGSASRNPWADRKRRKAVDIDQEMEDLTAFATMAAAQISRDYVARCRR